MQDEARIGEIIRAHPYLTAALEAARDIAAPDWLVSAGAVRDAVWDALHGRALVAPRDVDEEKGWRERWPRLDFR